VQPQGEALRVHECVCVCGRVGEPRQEAPEVLPQAAPTHAALLCLTPLFGHAQIAHGALPAGCTHGLCASPLSVPLCCVPPLPQIAQFAAELERYPQAIKIYEEVAGGAVDNNLLKYRSAGLCLCVGHIVHTQSCVPVLLHCFLCFAWSGPATREGRAARWTAARSSAGAAAGCGGDRGEAGVA
jgi:hypothetical protein